MESLIDHLISQNEIYKDIMNNNCKLCNRKRIVGQYFNETDNCKCKEFKDRLETRRIAADYVMYCNWMKMKKTKHITGDQLLELGNKKESVKYFISKNKEAIQKYKKSIKITPDELITVIFYYQYQLHRGIIRCKSNKKAKTILNQIKCDLEQKYPLYKPLFDNSFTESYRDPLYNRELFKIFLNFVIRTN